VHRLHLERLRDSRAAVALLPACRCDGYVPLPKDRVGVGPGVCRYQDGADRHLAHSDRAVAGGHRRADWWLGARLDLDQGIAEIGPGTTTGTVIRIWSFQYHGWFAARGILISADDAEVEVQ